MSRKSTSHEPSLHAAPHLEPRLDPTIRQRMLERIASLPFPAFAALVRQVLYRSGYSSVLSLGSGRTRKAAGTGGADLIAFAHTDLATAMTAVQIKQHRVTRIVPRRFVAELKGTMLQIGAEQGLLVVTSRFSSKAREAASAPGILPVQLIDGRQLVELMAARRLGLKQDRPQPVRGISGAESRWTFDPGYFDALEERARLSPYHPGGEGRGVSGEAA